VGAPFILTVDRRPEAARVARARVRAVCEGRAPRSLTDDVLIVVSELVTNAVFHGQGTITVLVGIADGGRVAVGVRDEGPGQPRLEDVDHASPRGRGIAMLARLAIDWGVLHDPAGGKLVWCLLAADEPKVPADRREGAVPAPVADLMMTW
jgi:anti-sigma regulatory factor (Ser/Thr protein kinase)